MIGLEIEEQASAAASLWKMRCLPSEIPKSRNMCAMAPSMLPAPGPINYCCSRKRCGVGVARVSGLPGAATVTIWYLMNGRTAIEADSSDCLGPSAMSTARDSMRVRNRLVGCALSSTDRSFAREANSSIKPGAACSANPLDGAIRMRRRRCQPR